MTSLVAFYKSFYKNLILKESASLFVVSGLGNILLVNDKCSLCQESLKFLLSRSKRFDKVIVGPLNKYVVFCTEFVRAIYSIIISIIF